jgi:Uncharacterized conserved protein
MKWTIAAIGRPKLPFARAGIEEYLGRIRHFAPIEFSPLRAGGDEGLALLERSEGCHRIVMDERGRQLTSPEFSRVVGDLELHGVKNVAVLVGGADGHSERVRKQADLLLGVSRFTLQHELALLVTLEQIYRAYGILRGTPYHRD